MSEINNQTNYSPAITKTSGSVHERWRLIKDSIARYGVVIGGLGVIVAIALIFFYFALSMAYESVKFFWIH